MTAMTEMPRYVCHKQVWALKIKEVGYTDSGASLAPHEAGYAPVIVGFDYLAKHKPEAGGYYVVYADGYRSYSPAKAFEDGYTREAP